MAGGQQINSAQGTLTAEGGDLLVLSGQAATGSQGAYTKGNSVRLRSRKVGGGSATHPLTGQALAASMGLFTPAPSVAPTTQVATLLGGSISATSREKALTGSATTSAAGTLTPAGAADPNFRYVTQTARGTGSGADWNNSMAFPSSFTRGLTYYVADGSYGTRTFSTALSGTTTITIKKATTTDHGTNVGWINGDGDGQAVFDTIILQRGYFIIDGTTRNESDWSAFASYGFRISSIFASSLDGHNAAGTQIKYCCVAPHTSDTVVTGSGQALYLVYNQTNITMSRCNMRGGTATLLQGAGLTNFTLEYSWIGPSWGKEALRGGNGTVSSGWIIRHNTFYQASQTDPSDNTSGITAEIGIWDASSGSFDNFEVYGNIFYNTFSGGRNACILIGGDGSGWVGVGGNNNKVYNNTFAGMPEAGVFGMIDLNGSGNEARNNLFWDTAGTGVGASTATNNVDAASNPFVNYAALNFHLTSSSVARNVGTALASTYNTDRDGTTRGADGTWDVGAYEYA
jgi:hypothetical protein